MAQKYKVETYADGSVVLSNIRNDLGIPVLGVNSNLTATKVNQWYDGTAMTDAKADGKIYLKFKGSGDLNGSYFKVNLPNDKELFLEKDTMAQMRDLNSTEILLLKMGYYKGIRLNGYYAKGDTPTPIDYFISNTSSADDGGSVIEVSTVKFIHDFNDYIDISYFGAKSDQSTNNSDFVQKSLNKLTTKGGYINIPAGCYFFLDSLVFPIKANLCFFKTDDRSRPSLISSATNEQVEFLANANAGGIVNEDQLSAAFHPGYIIDVRDDVPGDDSWLGPGQTRENPARASYNIRRQGVNKFRIVYQHYKDRSLSIANGTTFQPWRSEVVLNGISAASFTNTISVGNTISGSISKGYGIIKTISAGSITVILEGYKFNNGESVVVNGETSTTTISSQTVNVNVPLQVLSVDDIKGYWGFGCAPDENRSLLTIAGRLTIAPTRLAGQHVEKTETNSVLSFSPSIGPDYNAANGFDILMDNSKPLASRRLTLAKKETTESIGHIGAVRCHGSFTNTALVGTSSFNISTIVKNSTGDFTITFTIPFTRADYTVGLSTGNPMEMPYVFAKTTTSLRIRIATTGSSTLVDPTALIGVTCTGGDI